MHCNIKYTVNNFRTWNIDHHCIKIMTSPRGGARVWDTGPVEPSSFVPILYIFFKKFIKYTQIINFEPNNLEGIKYQTH